MVTENSVIRVNPEKVKLIRRSRLTPLTKRQFAFYLRDSDLYSTVKALIDADPDVALEYEVTYRIERSSPTVSLITARMGFTEEQIDDMWLEALQY